MTAEEVRFLPEHCVRVEVASSGFSRFEGNPQSEAAKRITGGRSPVIAQQWVYHDVEHLSYISVQLIAVSPGAK
jgi:predicted acyl esterase